MKVALFGGTGFVGSHIIDNLLSEGHKPKLLVRSESIYKVPSVGDCELVIGDVNDKSAVRKTIEGTDAVIYTIGIISCLLYTSPSPRDGLLSRMPSSA